MKIIIIVVLAIVGQLNASAQIEHPVKWSYASKKINSNEAMIFLKATINASWHIYSLEGKDDGPVKTSFVFTPSADYTLQGEASEPKPVIHFEKDFNKNVGYFENTVVFQQRIKLKNEKALVKGKVEFMACTNQKCLPPEDIDFSIQIQ